MNQEDASSPAAAAAAAASATSGAVSGASGGRALCPLIEIIRFATLRTVRQQLKTQRLESTDNFIDIYYNFHTLP